ncbi:MAG: EFR1 family ferrodoxin [Defluviitaleaceae bacterium]|nr:EFR1 family ferrodoxin [Defluviitaleaceae bacterium]
MTNPLVIYFSGTGNTKYIAELFATKTAGTCHSIEEKIDFEMELASHKTIAFCYPIYGSRAPYIMRRFASRHSDALKDKDVIIFVNQMIFSGDGARVFCDLFPKKHFKVIYADHFFMPNNVGNLFFLPKQSQKTIKKFFLRAEKKMLRVCKNIENGKIKKRGFSAASRFLGNIQGFLWQGRSKNVFPAKFSMERRAMSRVKIFSNCSRCGLCIKKCPMDNLLLTNGSVAQRGSCTVCYRCINLCPKKAVAIFFSGRPRWQYKSDVK